MSMWKEALLQLIAMHLLKPTEIKAKKLYSIKNNILQENVNKQIR